MKSALFDTHRYDRSGKHEPTPASATTDEERAYYRFNQKEWSIFAPFYDFVTRPLQRLRGKVCDLAKIGDGARVLDIATGTGEQAFAFAEKAREVVGVDLSAEMLVIAERKNRTHNTRFLRGDAAALPIPDGGFDAACVSFALHEMPRSVREKTIREMVRTVRPGGRIVVVDWSLPEGAAARWFVFHAVKSFEGNTYVDFVQSNVAELVAGAGVVVERRASCLGGIAQVLVGRTPQASIDHPTPTSESEVGQTSCDLRERHSDCRSLRRGWAAHRRRARALC